MGRQGFGGGCGRQRKNSQGCRRFGRRKPDDRRRGCVCGLGWCVCGEGGQWGSGQNTGTDPQEHAQREQCKSSLAHEFSLLRYGGYHPE